MSNNTITYRDLSNGDVEVCRDLCNALMQYQASKGYIFPEKLAAMNFDNRLKPSFEEAEEKLLLVAFDGEKAIGYVFAEVVTILKESMAYQMGVLPNYLPEGTRCGELTNLYVMPEYRGQNVGKELADSAMEWIKNRENVKHGLVCVSNGNNAATFYAKYGFEFSHDVKGGFVKAYVVNF